MGIRTSLRRTDILTGNFCRGCGYCLLALRILIFKLCTNVAYDRRAPTTVYMSKDWIDKMKAIED